MCRFIDKYREQLRYLFVGGWNTIFGYLVFTGLYFLLNRRFHYSLIFIISYVISITNSYICNKVFVFKTRGNYLIEYLRFYLVYALSFVINLGALFILVEYFKVHLLFAQAILTLLTIILSYFGHKFFSFRNTR